MKYLHSFIKGLLKWSVVLLLPFLIIFNSYSQTLIKDLSVSIDTATFSLKTNSLVYKGDNYLLIKASNIKEMADIAIITSEPANTVTLIKVSGITILDSLSSEDRIHWNGIIRFENLLSIITPVITVEINSKGSISTQSFKILPSFPTSTHYQAAMADVFQEEEKIIEIPATAPYNIITDNKWQIGNEFDFKISYQAGVLMATIKPHSLGYNQLSLELKTYKPVWNNAQPLNHELPPVKIEFYVKPNQLYFLNTDKNVIYADPGFRNSEDILIDYNPSMSLKKNYRIEDNSEATGNLIAELIPISFIENKSKILCRIKPYSLHHKDNGYLFIKEEGRARFITNFNIWERPQVTGIYLKHEGGEWTSSNTVNPGESIEVRIEGKGLNEASVYFGDLVECKKDTLKLADDAVFFKIKIPVTITSKNISLLLNKKLTSFELVVKEFQKPSSLDFIQVNYGKGNLTLTNEVFNRPIFYEDALKDVNLLFIPSKLDNSQSLNGKQYLQLVVRIYNRKNDLIEIQEIDNVVVCPGDNSPRKLFYNRTDCKQDAISLNDFLIHKTYQLEPFTQIEILVRHNDSKYGGQKGYSKKIKIILTRKVNFDVQVTFPTGLLVKKLNESGYGNLTGISTSILAQFNFYSPRMIGKLRPYNVGAGFIALNAFNFSSNANNLRDVGIVVLGSITPVRREAKFSLPIYVGGGYLLKDSSWFLVFGPGVQINF